MAKVALTPIRDLCTEITERCGARDLEVFSVSKNYGILPQAERFKKRVASSDTQRYKVLAPNDLAYDPMLLWSGSVARNETGRTGVISPAYTVFRPNERVNATYLLRYLQMEERLPFYSSISHGTNERRRKAHFKDFGELRIPLPALREQDRLVALLDEADALRKLRVRAEARTAQLIPAIFQEMFGVDKQTTVKLSDLIREGDKINYGVVQPGPDHPNGVPLVRVSDFSSQRISTDAIKRIAPEIEKAYTRSRLAGDEILISCVGQPGSIALADDRLKGFNIARAVARVPLVATVNREYVAAYLMSEPAQRYFRLETRTVNQPTLNIGHIEQTPVPLPTRKLQDAFAARVLEVRGLQAAQAQARAKVDALWGSLLGEVFG